MTIVQHRSTDRSVATIAARDALTPKHDHMTVVVLDAIGDAMAGPGKAVYRWNVSVGQWILITKDAKDILSFAHERKTIVGDVVQSSYIPADGVLWDVYVEVGNSVITQVEWNVVGSDINILPDTAGEFDGKVLSFKYAYGSLAQQIAAAVASSTPSADGKDGREVELRDGGTYIQWRYVDDAEWVNLIAVSALVGIPGTTLWSGITDKPTSFPPSSHSHDTEVATAITNALAAERTAVATLSGKTLTSPVIAGGFTEQSIAFTNTGTARTISLSVGTQHGCLLNANCTFTFPAPSAGKQFTLFLKQDATGSRVPTWPSSVVRWPDNVVPAFTSSPNRTDVVSFVSDPSGAYWMGFIGNRNYSLF